MAKRPGRPGLPTRETILAYIAQHPDSRGRRELLRAFKVAPAHRVALKGLLADIERSGDLAAPRRERVEAPTAAPLPETAVIELIGTDDQGEPLCRVIGGDDAALRIRLGQGSGVLGIGDRAIVRLRADTDGDTPGVVASVIRKLDASTERVVGVIERQRDGSALLTPTDRRQRRNYRIRSGEALGAPDGELVLAVPLPQARLGLPHAQVVERLGTLDDPRAISLVAIHGHGIPQAFPPAALAEAAAARPAPLEAREDLRRLPLVTIDGSDARDFDDAVFAEPDPQAPGHWHLLVAIADVAWYVRPGTALDRAAAERGNSVYFPDRVVPMLPEALSNELCSLKPGVDRACLAIHLWIDAAGRLTRHRVVRGLMRSAARLTYEQLQDASDGTRDLEVPGLADRVVAPLYAAYRALLGAREARGTLDLDLPERRVVLDPSGHVRSIESRVRLDSHRLIEEFMITANVAAAETLERANRPCLYRVHDSPDPERVGALSEFLDGLGIHGLKIARGQALKPRHFAAVLERAVGRPERPLINELVLRAQAQAVYAPVNLGERGHLGHFGLALQRYAHFTSPIRRYADLIVHRSLIDALELGAGGLGAGGDAEMLASLATHISATERRAAQAERSAVERFVALFLQDRVGARFSGRISGVMRFGLFVALDETGADGLIPVAHLPADHWRHDALHHTLTGQRTRRRFTLGDRVEVVLERIDSTSASMVFGLAETPAAKRAPLKTAGRKPAR